MQQTAVINRLHAFSIRLCVAMLLLLVLPAQAQEARLSGNVVYLPAVDDYPNLYSLELRVVANRFPIELTLQHVGTAQASLARDSPFYDGDLLIVPHIRINGSSYWAELRELSSDRFQLLGYGPNGNSNGGPHDHLGWQRLPGQAKDIGVGADGSVWIIGANERAGGYGVYRYNGSGWTLVPGSARQISVGPDGEPWVVNRDGDIYRSMGR